VVGRAASLLHATLAATVIDEPTIIYKYFFNSNKSDNKLFKIVVDFD
jgi:hypothetical protein